MKIRLNQHSVVSIKIGWRHDEPGLRCGTIQSGPLSIARGSKGAVLGLVRGGPDRDSPHALTVWFNLTDQRHLIPQDSKDRSALLWSSEDDRYCGKRMSETPQDILLPYECRVFGPNQSL